MEDFILDDLDSFSFDEELNNEVTDDDPDTDSTEESSLDAIKENIEAEFVNIQDDTNIESIKSYSSSDEANEMSSAESSTHKHYRQPSFRGHTLGWNGRCRVCSCGAWAGFGDTCANCGHFYNQHI